MPDLLIAPAVLTLKECAAYLHIGHSTLYGRARQGVVPSIKIGTRVMFPKAELDAWMHKQVEQRRKK